MIRSKIPNIGTSIFAEMTASANEHNAVNLSQGFPDFDIPKELIHLTDRYMRKGYNQYAPMPGVAELRNEIAKKIKRLYGYDYNPESEVTITAGGTQALYTVISATVHEGDEVIIFEPSYDSYSPLVKFNGGNPIYVSLKAPDYKVDWEEVNKLVSSRTKLIILNTPQNPTGKLLTKSDMEALSKLVSGTKIMILSDEVYEHLIFDDKPHESIAKYPALAKRSFLVYSFGKLFHATGWKVGYCVAPEELMKEFRKLHQFIVFAVNTPVQYAMAEMLKDERHIVGLPQFYQQKRDYFVNKLRETGFKIIPSDGTYFQLVDFSDITDMQGMELAKYLITEHQVAGIPVSAFYHNTPKSSVLRFCFAKSEATLDKATKKIDEFYKSCR